MRTLLRCALALLLGALPLAAMADPSDDPDTEIARRHFARARDLYANGQYEAAIVEFQAASRARPLVELEYNIARCLDRLERWPEAISHYERFIATAPASVEADEVRARVAELRARVEGGPLRRRPSWYLAPTLVGTSALVLGAVGAGLLGSVASDYRALDLGDCRMGCTEATYGPLERRAVAGYAVLAVAGAVALVDIGLFVAASRRAHPAAR